MQEGKTQEPKLMQMSIPRGWAIGDNKFYDAEPDSDIIANTQNGFVEDMLWLFEWRYEEDAESKMQLVIPEENHYTIDLSWKPDCDIDGQYYATLYWDGLDRIKVEQFTFKNRFDIRDKIEGWMSEITTNYQEAHSRFI